VKVYVFPADQTGCGAYRMIWPAEALAKIGCDVEVVHSAAEFLQAEILGGYRKSNGQMAGGRVQRVIIPPDTDVVVLQRPMSRYLAEAVPLLRDQGVTVVVEMDDDLESVHHRHPMRAKFDPAHNPEFNWDHAQKACDQATLVTATTRPLLAKYARTSPGVLIPNYAPDHLLDIPHTDSGQIGWGGSVFTHPDDPAVIGDALARLFTTAGQQLKIVGPGPANAVGREFGVKPRQVSVTGPIPIEDYAATVAAQIGVGIAPLQHSIFNSSKSWLKPLEYSALGIPWVASGLAEYRAFFAATGAGLIAESPKQWHQHLRKLSRSRVMRLELGEQGRRAVREGFTISGNAAQWWDAWAYAFQLQSAQVGVG